MVPSLPLLSCKSSLPVKKKENSDRKKEKLRGKSIIKQNWTSTAALFFSYMDFLKEIYFVE